MMYAKSLALLSKIACSDNMPHAFLFSGPDRAGKIQCAKLFFKWLFHKQNSTLASMRDCLCDNCYRIDSGVHPDLYMLGSGESPVSIKQMRTLKKNFSLAPFCAPYKAVIIDNAENMPPPSANAFLKLLEEPKGRVIFILNAVSRQALLPTVSSRTFEMRFIPERKWYEQSFKASGAVARVRLFEEGALPEIFHEIQKYTARNKKISPQEDLLRIKKTLIVFLDAWLAVLRSRALNGAYKHKDVVRARNILTARRHIQSTNVNPQLVMEELVLSLS